MKPILLFCAILLLAPGISAQQTYELKPTPKTVAWGYYDAATPVMRIKSGDMVEVQTLITSSPVWLDGVLNQQIMEPRSVGVLSSVTEVRLCIK